jgi:peptide/nickel transport system ATP-binding protein
VTQPLLAVRNLRVTYTGGGFLAFNRSVVKAVDDVSFEVKPGETFGLVGESGSGKSTTGRAILRLADVAGGSICFEGQEVTKMGRSTPLRYRREVQAIFQDPWSSLNSRKVIGEILTEPLRRHGLGGNRKQRNGRVAELLDQVGLAGYFAGRYPNELSGGQRQRVAIARALAVEPRFIVCDEAVSALDVSTQSQVINLLQELQEQLGLAYLFIAHDLSVVHHISHRIGVMYCGKLVEVGDSQAVYRSPQHPYSRALHEAEPIPNPRIQRQRVLARKTLRAAEPPALDEIPDGCPFHPRCPNVMDQCRSTFPPFVTLPNGSTAACHLHVSQSSGDSVAIARPSAGDRVA